MPQKIYWYLLGERDYHNTKCKTLAVFASHRSIADWWLKATYRTCQKSFLYETDGMMPDSETSWVGSADYDLVFAVESTRDNGGSVPSEWNKMMRFISSEYALRVYKR